MRDRRYAREIAKLLDPKGEYFRDLSLRSVLTQARKTEH